MAMRFLLRRIPRSVLGSTSGFRLEPVQGVPPAEASRFMGTQPQGEQRVWEAFDAEQMTARLRESIKAMNEEATNDQQMLQEQIADMRRQLNEWTRSLTILRRATTACGAALVAIPWTVLLWSEYQG